MRRFFGCVAAVTMVALVLGLCGFGERACRAAEEGAAAWAPAFYAYGVEIGVPGLKPRPLEEQAALLKQFGYEGAGHPLWFDAELDKNLAILDQAGLKLYMLYTTINLKQPEKACDPRLPAALARLKGRPVTINVLLAGLKPGDPAGMEPAVKILRQLGDLAAKSGLRISIYNHVGNWTESLSFILDVVKKTNHPQVGANFNLCHWLKVDGDKDYRPLLRENIDKIFVVTICGAQQGATAWTNGLIQPLDRGDFDNRELLTVLRQAGYRGPIGLMCYGIPEDAREYLARSMKVWKNWQADIAKPQ